MATVGGLLQSLGPRENLDIFDVNNLQTDESYRASCNAVIDRLVKFLQNNVPIGVKEIVKGGSLGKGTAIRGKSDIDLVLFLSDYHTVQSVKANMTQLLSILENHLRRYGGCRIFGTTKFSVQVEVSCHASHEHHVDILPACDVQAHGVATVTYQDMARCGDPQLLQYFSASFVKLQVAFVKELPAKVKSLIRLVKYWRKSEIPAGSGYGRWPTSYIMELITIKKWEDAGCPQSFDLKCGLYSVLRAIVNYNDLQVVWYKNYDRLYMQHRRPYVIDPANPFNNIMENFNVWPEVARYAQNTLQYSLFRGLGSTSLNNWNTSGGW